MFTKAENYLTVQATFMLIIVALAAVKLSVIAGYCSTNPLSCTPLAQYSTKMCFSYADVCEQKGTA